MKLKHYDTLNEDEEYLIEISRAEDVAENGEMANIKVMRLPSDFNPDNEHHWNLVMSQLKPVIVENDFDTLILRKETREEKLYIIERENV